VSIEHSSEAQPPCATTAAQGLWFGHRTNLTRPSTIGFVPEAGPPVRQVPDLIADDSDAHVLVVAPTGAGKGRNLLIPNLLQCRSSMVVVDIKGELALTTARYRREVLGHQVVVLDPFHRTGPHNDNLNPLDWLQIEPGQIADSALALAETITGEERGTKEPFWDHLANDLAAGLIAYGATHPDAQKRHMGAVWDLLVSQDADYQFAVLLDTDKNLHRFVQDKLSAYLQHEGEKVRSSALSTARQHMRIFSSPRLQETVTSTSFDLAAFRDGAPMTIYLVLPPQKLHSHVAILRLWLSVLMGILMERTTIPEQPTVFIVDELAQLGCLTMILQAVSLMRGFGLRCLLLLQSLNQIKSQSPAKLDVLLDNCGVLTTFGRLRHDQATQLAGLLGDVTAETLLRLPTEQLLVSRPGAATAVATKLDYLHDPLFRGRFDPNPYYAARNKERRPRPAQMR
jgi:type IV secretion system protein VirD4